MVPISPDAIHQVALVIVQAEGIGYSEATHKARRHLEHQARSLSPAWQRIAQGRKY